MIDVLQVPKYTSGPGNSANSKMYFGANLKNKKTEKETLDLHKWKMILVINLQNSCNSKEKNEKNSNTNSNK